VSGTTVRDLAGYFCDGTIVGSAAIVSGKSGYGNALSCTGGALQIVVPADTYPVNTDGGITVAAWVQLNSTTAAARCIASAKSSTLDWALYASNASGNVEMVVEGTAYSSSTSIRDGSWHHVMVVVDRTFGPGSETVKIAIDGTLVLSTTSLTTGLGYSGDATFNVGRNANTSAQALDGIVDDFRWFTTPVEPASWSAVRDAEQQDLQYAIYPFDDGTGDDQSIYNRDLTLAGTASFVSGLYGSALKSTSAAGGAATVNFGDVDRLSINGWLRLDTAPVGSAAPILAIADTGGSNKFRAVVNTDRTVTCTWVTIYGSYSVTSPGALTVGTWTRFEFGMNPTYVEIRLGTDSTTKTATSNGESHLAPAVLDLKTLYIGGDASGGGQVSFDYTVFTRNFIDVPANTYWVGPPLVAATRPTNVYRGYWDFNENTGTVADDKSTSNNDLTLSGSGSWATGVQGSALRSNGAAPGASDTSLAWPASPLGWTMAAWMNFHADGSETRILCMVAGSTQISHIGRESGAAWWRLFGSTGTTGQVIYSQAIAGIPLNTWVHTAAVCNGNTFVLYMNGKKVGAVPWTYGSMLVPTELQVGTNNRGLSSNLDVDDLVVYDTPLSPSNIAWLYANPGALATPPVDVTLGTAHETDTAYGLAPAKSLNLAAAHETDTAHEVGAAKSATLSAAEETDSAHPVSLTKTATLGAGSEVDAAYPVTSVKSAALATASETDSAYPVVLSKTVTLETAHEIDSAYLVEVDNLGAARVMQTAHEFDTAYPVLLTKTVTLQTAHETDRAFGFVAEGSGAKWPVLTVSNKPASRLEVSHGI
ncbi:MAG TPA: LamG domain-containing protein, partial [Kribbella sp.]